MARRNQRPGDHLASSDYSGCTTYASKLIRDYWGNLGEKNEILARNLQEIASPLSDPYPVAIYNGSMYENVNPCQFETQPTYIGRTNRPFPVTAYTTLFDLDPSIPNMSVGCTLVVA